MSFSNEHFQIFFNKSQPKKDDTGSNNSPIQNLQQTNSLEHVKRFTFSASGVYQTSPHTKANTNMGSLLDSVQGMNVEANVDQATDLSSHETLDYSDGYAIPTQRSIEDCDEKLTPSLFNNNSRKIKKDKLNPQARTFGSKKAMLDAYKSKTKRKPWQPEEDEQVIDLVAKYGQSWALIASLMKHRSGKQIRDRYLNKLKPDINKAEWTPEEDDLLMVLCRKVGHKWSRIATQLPGRTEGQVKNRFYSHIKKRMPKWNGVPEAECEEEEELEEADSFTADEASLLRQLHSESPLIKEETASFGFNREIKAAQKSIKTIQSLNCAGNYKIENQATEQVVSGPQMAFGSLSIRVNTFNQASIKKEERTYSQIPSRGTMNVKTTRYDPTDVISYDNYTNVSSAELCSTADEIKSPFSAQTSGNIFLSSTRASSYQDKELDDAFAARMGSTITKVQPSNGKSNMISFSITNGNIVTNKSPAMKTISLKGSSGNGESALKVENPFAKGLKEVNQLDFTSGSHKINLKIC